MSLGGGAKMNIRIQQILKLTLSWYDNVEGLYRNPKTNKIEPAWHDCRLLNKTVALKVKAALTRQFEDALVIFANPQLAEELSQTYCVRDYSFEKFVRPVYQDPLTCQIVTEWQWFLTELNELRVISDPETYNNEVNDLIKRLFDAEGRTQK